MSVVLQGDKCSRCGRHERDLLPYTFSLVVYRGKPIEFPWLCVRCINIEKAKAWRAIRALEVTA
ncbi:MAG: hypothetical protein Q7O66_13810 [Dehalococcoidia bacterium]|nr:hypothetical protein [Dehalococcoidia bacterium]